MVDYVVPAPSPVEERPPAEKTTYQVATERLDELAWWVRSGLDAVVVGAVTVFIVLQLGPSNLLSDSTPAGGDMGAHVWGPAFLRDHLLPDMQLAGWSPDWYAGFSAYQFYMVVPSLLIVFLDVGVVSVASVPGVVLAVVGAGWIGASVGVWTDRRWRAIMLLTPLIVLGVLDLPYGVAFKLVAVSGSAALPLAAYTFGRMVRLPFPGPALAALAALPFLFYRGYSIYGGNLASMLAGEFAFSMSLSLGVVYLGVLIRGLETGRHRGLAAALLALCGLCHIIPAFWVLTATVVLVFMNPRVVRTWPGGLADLASGGVLGPVALALRPRRRPGPLTSGLVLLGAGTVLALAGPVLSLGIGVVLPGGLLAAAGAWLCSRTVRWLTPVLAVGGALSAFWVVPFLLRSPFVNDMGWEKLPTEDDGGLVDRWGQHLLPGTEADAPPENDLRWVFVLAVVGLVLSIVWWAVSRVSTTPPGLARGCRIGVFLGIMTVITGFGFVLIPEGRLWNGRILPFYYLTATLLAFLTVTLILRLLAYGFGIRPTVTGAGGALAAAGVVMVLVALPLGVVPLDESVRDVEGGDPTGYRWPAFSPWQAESSPRSFLPGWADWNFSGYEGKDAWPEYRAVVDTMARIGEENGCGRALWEYEEGLDRYGTPMALMLLPYWTDGCIGSMEGLFFESSMTTPYHFLMQTELSESPSSAQRDMPYSGFNLDLGVQHLQLMGVRYYMATTDIAIESARNHEGLTEIATSGPWEIFEVDEIAENGIVEALPYRPAVLEDADHDATSWLEEPRAWATVAEQGREVSGSGAVEGPWPGAPSGWASEPPEGDPSDGRYFGPSVQWFLNPGAWDVPLAVSGPDDWQRVTLADRPDLEPVRPAEVSEVEVERDRISFEVDQPGTPILVKASYFPNWEVHGGDGPWRVAPNLMVVIPTDNEVELVYGRTSVEWGAYALTALGLLGLVLLVWRGRVVLDP